MKRNRDFEKEKEILKRQQKHTENTEENNFSYEMENEKIESLYVTREMAEDKEMDEKIRQDLIRAADEAEKASQEEEALGTSIPMGAEEKQQLFDDIVNELKRKGIWEEDPEEADGDRPEKGTSPCPARPEDQLSAEDQEALRLGRELLHTPKKKNPTILPKILKGIAGAAVVALGVFVLSMSSEANRVKLLSAWNSIVGDELRVNIDDNRNQVFEKELEEQEAYEKIEKNLNIEAPKIIYIPEGMRYDDYLINNNDKMAVVYYNYNDVIISICMYNKDSNSNHSQKFDGEIVDSVQIYAEEIDTEIWKLDDSQGDVYVSQFERGDIYYTICGNMEEKEFKKMISSIIF